MEIAEKLKYLGQATDSTWGHASTDATCATMSIKASMHGEDGLSLLYISVINLGSIYEIEQAKAKEQNLAIKAVDKYIGDLKKEFKELSGKALKVKKVSDDDSVELISMSHCSPRRLAYYRFTVEYNATV